MTHLSDVFRRVELESHHFSAVQGLELASFMEKCPFRDGSWSEGTQEFITELEGLVKEAKKVDQKEKGSGRCLPRDPSWRASRRSRRGAYRPAPCPS